jgi:integrase
MASVWKSRKSKFWIGCYTAADGRQLKRTTRETDKRKAMMIAQSWEELETNSARGYLSSEEQFRLFVDQKYRLLFGKDSQLDLTVRAWLEQWLVNEKGAVAPNTLERYRQVMRDFLAFLGSRAELRLEALSSADCVAFRDHLLKEGHTEGNANQIKKILSKPFRHAWQEGRIQRNPVAGVRHLRHERAEKGTFTPEQIAKLLSAAEKQPEWQTLILLGYFTGGRLTDLAGLKWENIDLAEASLVFTQKKTAHRGPKATLKIPLHPQLHDHLLSLRTTDNPRAALLKKLSHTRGTGKSGLSMAFKKIMAEAGIEAGVARERKGTAGRNISRLSFHSLRHSFTSNLANAGVPPELRQKLTGHLDDKSHSVYTHHEFQTIREALEKLGRLPK